MSISSTFYNILMFRLYLYYQIDFFTDEGFQLDLDVESNLRTLHVVKCLAGNSSAFIDEWEFGFKSILVNAPLDSNLHVHIIAARYPPFEGPLPTVPGVSTGVAACY